MKKAISPKRWPVTGGMDDGDSDRLPVFLSVSEIEFPVTERSPRRVITIYNPYGYPIQYKVLCNAPGNYSVPNFKGMLLAKSCKDLLVIVCLCFQTSLLFASEKLFRVVRCTSKLTVGTTDRLRIEIMRPGETEVSTVSTFHVSFSIPIRVPHNMNHIVLTDARQP
ncbi:unnamed protein product [Heligmosomoides polygyrus]|uniref:MSP domain-containing protein n=1 Tax=Heligmosomoides polygyrus TaxID=6339 RepID=A0A3P7WR67_HELPZ|nr:unnamed protein product [Heligmosomoides polygyrus]